MTGRMLTLLLAGWIAAGAAEEVRPRPELITPAAEAAINHGLAYLARTQRADGSWVAEGQGQPVAMTALACLALMCGGHTPSTGAFADQVARGIEFLLRACGPDGLIASGDGQSMHGHGFALLTLAHAYGMESNPLRNKRLAQVLRQAIALTVASQTRDGGWYYSPNSSSDEGSVTVTQIQGLRACREAGLAVPPATIQRACEYLQQSANLDGGISYAKSTKGKSQPAITAAAIATLYSAGQFEHPVALGALRYVDERLKASGGNVLQAFPGHTYYALLYCGQALWFTGERRWKALFPRLRDALVLARNPAGVWTGDGVGVTFGTSVALIVLQLPYRQLPLLQR